MLLVPLHTLAARMLQNTKRIVRPHNVLCHRKQRLDIRTSNLHSLHGFRVHRNLGICLVFTRSHFIPFRQFDLFETANIGHRRFVFLLLFLSFRSAGIAIDSTLFIPTVFRFFVAIVILSMPPVVWYIGFKSFITPRSFSGYL